MYACDLYIFTLYSPIIAVFNGELPRTFAIEINPELWMIIHIPKLLIPRSDMNRIVDTASRLVMGATTLPAGPYTCHHCSDGISGEPEHRIWDGPFGEPFPVCCDCHEVYMQSWYEEMV